MIDGMDISEVIRAGNRYTGAANDVFKCYVAAAVRELQEMKSCGADVDILIEFAVFAGVALGAMSEMAASERRNNEIIYDEKTA